MKEARFWCLFKNLTEEAVDVEVSVVSYNVFPLCFSSPVSEKERIVDLGTLTGKLTSGTGNISGFKEDKRNKANPG